MYILPAIDIKGGKCVRLTQGDYNQEKIYGDDPVEMAKKWKSQGSDRLHIVDLDGAREGKFVNIEIVKRIIQETGMEVQTGGGIRSLESARNLIESGVNKIILGTIALDDKLLLQECIDTFNEKVIVSLDANNGRLMKKGWLEESGYELLPTVKRLEGIGVQTIIYTDTAKDGMLEGPNYPMISKLREATSLKLIIAGGVSILDDIKKLEDIDVEGVILGKALYEGKINLREAIEYVS